MGVNFHSIWTSTIIRETIWILWWKGRLNNVLCFVNIIKIIIFKHEFFGRAWNVRKRYEFYQCSQVIWLRQLE